MSQPDDAIAAQQTETGSMSEGSRLSGGFDSVVQAGMMFLQANVMRSAYTVAKRYYNIAAKDDATWQSLYAPVMKQFADEMFAVPVRPLDVAFFRARNLAPAATIQKDWYNMRLMTSRYAYGVRENLDYKADMMTRWTRVTSAFLGVSMAEAYFETYKEQRRVHMAQAVALGKNIQTSSMSMLGQAATMKSAAATGVANALSSIGGTVRGATIGMQEAVNKVKLERQYGMKDENEIGQRSFGALAAIGLGIKQPWYTGANISNGAGAANGSGTVTK